MDIRTLAVILGIIQVAELIVFALLASVNRSYRGIGWWLLGSALAASGIVFMILRAFPALRLVSVLAQDTLILLAMISFYVGIMRFLDRREPRGMLIVVFAVFFVAHVYFTVGRDDINARTLALCAGVIVISLLTTVGLWRYKPSVGLGHFLASLSRSTAPVRFRGAAVLRQLTTCSTFAVRACVCSTVTVSISGPAANPPGRPARQCRHGQAAAFRVDIQHQPRRRHHHQPGKAPAWTSTRLHRDRA
jgi:hypothetical protein